ncbi:lysophospholipid acyltransferase family protein [Colwellia sp. BRX10-6]|uniref:lysophospholipid acyltransferase family protein n=1 Tax=unclassified Colwellia TaxID=196834 RepID=UPI0015F69B6C|nr:MULTISPECIES: GNAT family N-acyltransferase [unclassified Colwellia]MBA6372538.1 lysophospholipid acyltransferase family protein [Colwellia sp. BRX8-4]MBA6383876.1 lysophospholipid acyltransferase family protein [Colwellia sp. BRX10-9]MBA6393881.1 lysophospholipid acyltransferase family protein [Colwellia sp. BRX10-6]
MNNEPLEKPYSDLRLAAMAPNTLLGTMLKITGPFWDKLLGISKLRRVYESCELSGLNKQEFSQKLLNGLGVQVSGINGVLAKIPQRGRCIIVCNHPYGMIEGVIIAYLLTEVRADTKVMANVGLTIFKEIKDYFIFANPLKPKALINGLAIKQCFRHLEKDGLLVIFPAGRVSFFQADKQRIADADWNRLAIKLATKTDSPILPVFISGANSKLFHNMGRVYYRFRLLMLAHEMFKLQAHNIALKTNNLLTIKQLNEFNGTKRMNDFVRLQCYLNDDNYFSPWLEHEQRTSFEAVIPMVDKKVMKKELAQLPEIQHLLDFKSFSVYYGYQQQIPHCVEEITRLREITFRTLDEGSGEACDTDKFDATYMHLFIFDHKNEEIIGAYRIGQTDLLQKNGDVSKLYLAQMFDFAPEFINQQQPCLEMGRSFIIAAHQNSFHGLLLLWKGIGAFVCQNPHYRTLYGTVSLSKLYDPRSVALIDEIMVTDKEGVSAKKSFAGQLHPEVKDFISAAPVSLNQLSALVMGIEKDGKDVPVLLKQYYKLGAKFHCTGIDVNFNDTPGLLLSVNLPAAPDKLLKLYLGSSKAAYINYAKSGELSAI